MQVYLAAIRAFHVLNGFPVPPITTPRIHLALRSLFQSASPVKQAHPITFNILSLFHHRLTDSFDDLALWSCMTVMFFGCLRASELIPSVEQYKWGFQPPRIADVQFASPPDEAVIIKIARTKTKPTGRLLVLGCTQHHVCPYCAIANYLCRRGIRDTKFMKGPLFIRRDGTVLDKGYVRSRQTVLLAALGLNPEGFTTHSYRSGSATTLAMNGHFDLIPHIGDWASLCYLRYVRTPLSSLSALSAKFVPSDQ